MNRIKESLSEKDNSNTVVYINDDDDDVLAVINTSVLLPERVLNNSIAASLSNTNANVTEVLKSTISESVLSSLKDLIVNIRVKTKSYINNKIHNIFSLCYKHTDKYDEMLDFKTSTAQSLFSKVFYRWEGWNPEDPKYNLCLEAKVLDLYNTLMTNLAYICNHLDDCIKQTICEQNTDVQLTIYCSLKMLKTFFNNEPKKCKSYYNVTIPPELPAMERLEPEAIINWPFVKIKVSLPGFEMIHENKNNYNFKIVNLKRFKAVKKISKENTNLLVKHNPERVETVSVHDLIEYLRRLKSYIIKNNNFHSKKRRNLYTVLTELECDIFTCVDFIMIDCEYNMNLHPYPYHRYLGRPYLRNTPHKTIADQLSIRDENGLNIRLLQTMYPVLSFTLKRCTCTRLTESFVLFENVINDCLIYQCSFCCLTFDSLEPQDEMVHHLATHHGVEPDWICSKCDKSYSMKDLSSHRWYHTCT